MRILGWLLLVGGFLLCASILWAAPGFLCMGLGLIFLQIAEQKRLRAKPAAASPPDQSKPQVEPPPLQELTRARVPPKADEKERENPENTTVLDSYDKQRWRSLLSSDADISRLAKALAPYGQKYVDEFAAAYLVLNDKDYLPMILRKIVASASRDPGQNVVSDLPDKNTDADAVGLAFDRTRRADRAVELGSDYTDKPASVDNVPKIDVGPERERVSGSSRRKFSGHVDLSAVRTTAAERTKLEPVAADAESDVSAPHQIAAEATKPKPPAVQGAAAGRDEERRTAEVDAVDADNLTDILNRLSQVLTAKSD
jgi:hypothetical protein